MGGKRGVGNECTWVLCWTDSWTIGEMASSRSVGMIDLLVFNRAVFNVWSRAVVVWYDDAR